MDIIKSGAERVETLVLKHASVDKPVEKKDVPVAPKITGTPAVDEQTEKAAADSKSR